MISQIGEIAEPIPFVSLQTKCDKIDQIFKGNPKLQGVAVVDINVPIALVMRARFYQQMGTLYGYNLYMGRSVGLIMNRSPLIVDYSNSIIEVSKRSMNRPEEELYDDVLVTQNNELYGAVSIRNLLLSFAEIQAQIASYMNPLTGLPGNLSIDEKLRQSMALSQFSVFYIDLDHFKAYNDTYGFLEGDRMIQATAEMLRSSFYQPDAFVGHIGGDDFIAILEHHDYAAICEKVISEFDEMVQGFYNEIHLRQNYVVAENRAGVIEHIPLVSLSIAIVTNETRSFTRIEEIVEESARIKKRCKRNKGSCYYTNQDDCSLAGS